MQTFDTLEPILVFIDIADGHIRINASARTDTTVDVRPTDETDEADVETAKQVQVMYSDHKLSVTAPRVKARSFFRASGSIDVTVHVPAESRVDATTGSAQMRCRGHIGESKIDIGGGELVMDQASGLDARTASGAIRIEDAAGDVRLYAKDGDIAVNRAFAAVEARTESGRVRVGEVAGDVRLYAKDGDIAVDRAFAAVEARTESGRVRIGEVMRGRVNLESDSGILEIGIREGSAVWADLSSWSGQVRNSLESAESPETADNVVELRAHSHSGDIVLTRS